MHRGVKSVSKQKCIRTSYKNMCCYKEKEDERQQHKLTSGYKPTFSPVPPPLRAQAASPPPPLPRHAAAAAATDVA